MRQYLFFISCCFLLIAGTVTPQRLLSQAGSDSSKAASLQKMLEDQQYSFKPQSVTPLSGRLRQLDAGYELKVSKEKITCQLPYFGRAYSAPMDPAANSFQFSSTQFKHTVKARKKDGWNISIVYSDAGDVKQMQLTVFSNGSASLQATSNNRQSISYNGYITAPDKKP